MPFSGVVPKWSLERTKHLRSSPSNPSPHAPTRPTQMEQHYRQHGAILPHTTGASRSGLRRRRLVYLRGYGDTRSPVGPLAAAKHLIRLDTPCRRIQPPTYVHWSFQPPWSEHRGVTMGCSFDRGYAQGDWGRRDIRAVGVGPRIRFLALCLWRW